MNNDRDDHANTRTVSVLGRAGDLKLTWDHASEPDRARAREELDRLEAAGYSFFLTDDSPADAVTAGAGTLLVRRTTAAELTQPDETPADEATLPPETPAPKRRGRPPKQAVAVRPLQGG